MRENHCADYEIRAGLLNPKLIDYVAIHIPARGFPETKQRRSGGYFC